MNKTYSKLMFRSIKHTFARFISILAIVMLGVGFLCGLLATTPDMQYTTDKYYDDYNLFDIDIKSALGMTSDDLTFLSDCNFVETAMPAYVTDIQLECKSQNYVTRIYGTPLINGKSAINTFQLIDGRLPQNSSECVISSTNNYHENPYGIGDTFTISSENKNYEKLSDTYAFNSLTVVGIVKSPCYISIETEPSSVGTGTVGIIMFVMPDCYNLEAYTDLFLKIKGAAALDTFSDKYFDLIDESIDKLEDIGIHRSEIRYNSVVRDATDKLDEAKNKYDEEKQKADTELADARKKLDDGKKQLEEATTSLSDAKKQFELLKPSLSENQIEIYEAQIKDSEAIIIENTKKLADGDKEYAENYEKAQTELANAKIKIDSAQKDISAIKIPEWYVSDRRDTVSFASYRSNSNKVAAIARVFPIFFFLVAALVALTTMTRMIDEERMQIGTLKALGYSKSKILMYYLFYGISASFIGGLAGAIMGFKIFPIVISNAYGILYSLPKTITLFYADYAVFTISIAVACTVLATLGACLSQLYEKPSTLLLPKAPKAGKRIFLEHIGIIWKHLGFIKKVTARNVFRYKKRFYMTVFGIAGCCALLVTGFGLRDSIHSIVERQFGELYKYNLSLYLSEDSVTEKDAILQDILLDKSAVNDFALIHSQTGSVDFENESGTLNIVVPKNVSQLKENIVLRNRKTGKDIPFDENSFIVTEKLCETLGISVGDKVALRNYDGKTSTITVSGIAENYITAYAFLSPALYEKSFGSPIEYDRAFVSVVDDSDDARAKISERILESDNVLMLQFTQTIRESFENTVKSIDYIVLVLIVAAGALAMIVLYNLTNINICERRKELATIKVLGFRRNEVASYIYRETTILCLIGTTFGFAVGAWLHNFVVRTAEVDSIMFGRTASFTSYLYATIITLIFTAIVDLIMLKKLNSINMVESMKANE